MIITRTVTKKPLWKETRWAWTDSEGRAHTRVFMSADPAATDEQEARLCREGGGGKIVRINTPGESYAVLRDGNGYQEWVQA